MPIKFYSFSYSQPSWFIHLVLEYKAIPYERVDINLFERENKTEAFKKISERQKVPAIQNGDFSFSESLVILDYLERHFPHNPLLPLDTEGRYKIKQQLQEMVCYTYTSFSDLILYALFKPKENWNENRLKTLVKNAKKELFYWEEHLTEPFLNKSLYAADLLLYPLLQSLNPISLKHPEDLSYFSQEHLEEQFPKIKRFKKTIGALPLIRETEKIYF